MSIPQHQSVPMSVRHRMRWRRWRRVCVCGLRWPCLDRDATGEAARVLTASTRIRWTNDAATLHRLLDGLRGWRG
jgi:hypothetical protein